MADELRVVLVAPFLGPRYRQLPSGLRPSPYGVGEAVVHFETEDAAVASPESTYREAQDDQNGAGDREGWTPHRGRIQEL